MKLDSIIEQNRDALSILRRLETAVVGGCKADMGLEEVLLKPANTEEELKHICTKLEADEEFKKKMVISYRAYYIEQCQSTENLSWIYMPCSDLLS